MNYDQAKALMIEHHDNLLIDADDGKPHINIRKSEDGAPFSIMLPNLPKPVDIPYRAEIPGELQEDGSTSPTIPAQQAVSGEATRDQAERKMLLDALKAAATHL